MATSEGKGEWKGDVVEYDVAVDVKLE